MNTFKQSITETYTKYIKETQPLIDEVERLPLLETENFKISVIFKNPYLRVPFLSHDWLKIVEGSLNHNDIKKKTLVFINTQLLFANLHTDFRENLVRIKKEYFDSLMEKK